MDMLNIPHYLTKCGVGVVNCNGHIVGIYMSPSEFERDVGGNTDRLFNSTWHCFASVY